MRKKKHNEVVSSHAADLSDQERTGAPRGTEHMGGFILVGSVHFCICSTFNLGEPCEQVENVKAWQACPVG